MKNNKAEFYLLAAIENEKIPINLSFLPGVSNTCPGNEEQDRAHHTINKFILD